jgi:hypothetical protein
MSVQTSVLTALFIFSIAGWIGLLVSLLIKLTLFMVQWPLRKSKNQIPGTVGGGQR